MMGLLPFLGAASTISNLEAVDTHISEPSTIGAVFTEGTMFRVSESAICVSGLSIIRQVGGPNIFNEIASEATMIGCSTYPSIS